MSSGDRIERMKGARQEPLDRERAEAEELEEVAARVEKNVETRVEALRGVLDDRANSFLETMNEDMFGGAGMISYNPSSQLSSSGGPTTAPFGSIDYAYKESHRNDEDGMFHSVDTGLTLDVEDESRGPATRHRIHVFTSDERSDEGTPAEISIWVQVGEKNRFDHLPGDATDDDISEAITTIYEKIYGEE